MRRLPWSHDDPTTRQHRAASRLASWLNAHDLPGVEPFTWREKLLFWGFVAAVVAIVYFGSALLPTR